MQRYENDTKAFQSVREYEENKLSGISKATLDLACNSGRQLILMPFRAGAFLECGIVKVLKTITNTQDPQKDRQESTFCDIFEQSP